MGVACRRIDPRRHIWQVSRAMKQKIVAPLPLETFRFLRDLSRHNDKNWMDAHRDRYRQELVEPMRALLDALTQAVLDLDASFVINGKTGTNLSRINRDIRFARDARFLPYRPEL